MRRWPRLPLSVGGFLAAAALLAACSASGPTAGTSTSSSATSTSSAVASCSPARPHQPGHSSGTFAFNGATRTYQMYVPASYTGRSAVPVVFEFHGFGSNAVQQIIYGNFAPEADRHGFLVVAPDGRGSPQQWGLMPGAPSGDDVPFILALADHLEQQLCVDPHRLYATGMSDGGVITSVLACRASDRFAAYASVSGNLYGVGCTPASRPVPMLMFHGTSDPIIPYAGGRVNCCGHPTLPSVESIAAQWASHDHCAAAPVASQSSPHVRLTSYPGCAPGSIVELYSIEGGGHTWPGSAIPVPLGNTTHEIDASSTIWAFFATHPGP